MEKQHQTKIISHGLVITIIISLAIASFALYIICESKKSKVCLYESYTLHTHMLILHGVQYIVSTQAFAGVFPFCRRTSFELMEIYAFCHKAKHLVMELQHWCVHLLHKSLGLDSSYCVEDRAISSLQRLSLQAF